MKFASSCPQLKEIDLSGTELGGRALRYLADVCPKLKRLGVGSIETFEDFLYAIEKLPGLQALSYVVDLRDKVPETFEHMIRSLHDVTELNCFGADFHYADVEEIMPHFFTKFANLKFLNIKSSTGKHLLCQYVFSAFCLKQIEVCLIF